MQLSDTRVTGSCLCGKITLIIDALSGDVVYCHCNQCRKQSGHFFAATRAADDQLHIDGEAELTWYAASADAKRGFCKTCGSVLFWKANGSRHTSVLAGCLDHRTTVQAAAHIYTDDKGDYYEITDGLVQHPQSD